MDSVITRTAPDWRLVWARPGRPLRPGVLHYHGFHLNLPAPRTRLELPGMFASLVIVFAGDLQLVRDSPAGPADSRQLVAVLSGPRTGSTVGVHGGRLTGVEVTMTPWAAYTLFGVPMSTMTNRAVSLTDVLGSAGTVLLARLAEARDDRERFTALEAVLNLGRSRGPASSEQVRRAFAELSRRAGDVTIAKLAADVGWDARRLQRAFGDQIGLPPKTVARVLRLQHAVRRLAAGERLAQVALRCGYFDQAHFTREVTEMTVRPPLRLLAELLAAPASPPNLSRVAGQITSVVLSGAGSAGC